MDTTLDTAVADDNHNHAQNTANAPNASKHASHHYRTDTDMAPATTTKVLRGHPTPNHHRDVSAAQTRRHRTIGTDIAQATGRKGNARRPKTLCLERRPPPDSTDRVVTTTPQSQCQVVLPTTAHHTPLTRQHTQELALLRDHVLTHSFFMRQSGELSIIITLNSGGVSRPPTPRRQRQFANAKNQCQDANTKTPKPNRTRIATCMHI